MGLNSLIWKMDLENGCQWSMKIDDLPIKTGLFTVRKDAELVS